MAVAIRRGTRIKNNLEEIFTELSFTPGKRVCVKPNLCGRMPILPGENTSIEVLDALLEILLSRGCEVSIGHGALLGSRERQTSFAETLRESGFDTYLNMPGVRVVNLDELDRSTVRMGEMTFHLPLRFLQEEIDTYINLAKIKTHMETGVSFSLKNQMGLPAPEDRRLMHRTNLEHCIALLGLVCRPAMNILEGYPAMEGNGPHHGSANNLRLVAAGTDMVELDSLVAGLLGYEAEAIGHISHAAELGVGTFPSRKEIERHKEHSVADFRKAKTVYRYGRNYFAYPTFSCSLCISAVDRTGREIKRHPLRYWRFLVRAFLARKKHFIVFGKADRLSVATGSTILCVGSCARKFADLHGGECLDRCPPSLEETLRFLTK
jgi:uncharacterized protein (DUF362 family)